MPSAEVVLAVTIAAVELIQIVANLKLEKSSYQEHDLEEGARWISCQRQGWVISACYHPTKWHTATVRTGVWPFNHEDKSRARPGEWAVAWHKCELGVDKTFYNF